MENYTDMEEACTMEYPMRADLKVGNKFPDFELPDHTGDTKKLSHLLRGMPGALIFNRGHY
jgi:peroxiredoxin